MNSYRLLLQLWQSPVSRIHPLLVWAGFSLLLLRATAAFAGVPVDVRVVNISDCGFTNHPWTGTVTDSRGNSTHYSGVVSAPAHTDVSAETWVFGSSGSWELDVDGLGSASGFVDIDHSPAQTAYIPVVGDGCGSVTNAPDATDAGPHPQPLPGPPPPCTDCDTQCDEDSGMPVCGASLKFSQAFG